MSLNKKQKKQVDLAQKKLQQLRLQLSGARKQLDEPAEVSRLQKEIADLEQEVARIRSE